MTITEFEYRCFQQAKELGWHERPIPISEMIVLIHSEASEALEAYRNHEPISWTDEHGKPQGIGSEFADIMIRVGHYAALLGIDLAAECKRKLDYNMTRGHRHGGKEC
jgi:NTP pyrophosphatase (non-canonical NTP hydrolase)